MDVEIKKPSELTDTEIGAWRAFQNADPALCSPYFNVEFAQIVESIRSDTRVAVMSVGGQIKAFFAFHPGPFGYARVLAGALSDFHGVVAEPGFAPDLSTVMRGANLCILPMNFVPKQQQSLSNSLSDQEDCHITDLREGYDVWYERQRSKHAKIFKTLRNAERRLVKEHGDLSFSMEDDCSAMMDVLLKWKSEQYKASRFFDVFSVPWTGALLRALQDQKAEGFRGQLSVLRAGGKPVAIHMGMRNAHCAHYWFPAYDPTYARYSAGHILLMNIIQHHEKSGVSIMHLGIGDHRYKSHFGGSHVPLVQGTAVVPSAIATVRSLAHFGENLFENLPLGPVSSWPLRARRRFDRVMAFKLA